MTTVSFRMHSLSWLDELVVYLQRVLYLSMLPVMIGLIKCHRRKRNAFEVDVERLAIRECEICNRLLLVDPL